jgi:uncharacterized protein YjbI with pentapeptide repeats
MTTGPRFLKPADTEFIHRVYSPAQGRFCLSVGLLVPFSLETQATALPDLQGSLWDIVSATLGKDTVLDEGWPKVRGEFLAAGACYPPPGHTGQPVSASIAVGPLKKRLAVFGDRTAAAGGRLSAPAPFSAQPLGWAFAFGGEHIAHNPVGKAVPNVEDPDHPMLSPSDRPAPAGFGPYPSTWPQRASLLGRFESRWRNERWPHLPLDTDARFFQAAPPDQQLEGFWAGGEAVEIRNMHPGKPDLLGRVPQHRVRLFAHQLDASGQRANFHELNVNLDTVWLLPDTGLGLAIYRGLLPVQHPEARDVGAVLGALEAPGSSGQPVEYYLQQCLQALGKIIAQETSTESPVTDTAALMGMSVPELLQQLRRQRELFNQTLNDTGLDEPALLARLDQNPATRQLAQSIRFSGGSLAGFFEDIERLMHDLSAPSADTNAQQAPPSDHSQNDALPPAYLVPEPAAYAPVQAPPAGPLLDDPALAAGGRQQVLARQSSQGDCAGLDLSHANLAGLNLSGMNFEGALLLHANFSGAQLRDARLNGAYLNNARFDGADLSGAQLANCSANDISFCGANLSAAVLNASDFTGGNFSDARLDGAQAAGTLFSQAWMSRVSAAGIQAPAAQFDNANLDGADLSGAALEKANAAGASLKAAILSKASAASLNLGLANLEQADLTRCDLQGSQAGLGTRLHSTRLDGANLEQCSWMGASLENATLTAVKAMAGDFSDAVMKGVIMTGADASGASFDRADLTRANLSHTNLLQASFMQANLTGAWLENTNLYGATFVDTVLQGVHLDGAVLEKTALDPKASRN